MSRPGLMRESNSIATSSDEPSKRDVIKALDGLFERTAATLEEGSLVITTDNIGA